MPRGLTQDVKSSLQFTGGTSYVNVSNAKILGGLTAFTISAWINCISPGSDPVYSERASAGNDILKMDILALNNGAKLTLTYRDDEANLTQISSTLQLPKGSWQHVAITRNGATVTFYVNGVSTGTASMHASTTTNFTNANIRARIGGDAGDGSANFEGKISKVKIFTSSLSTTEIMSLYASDSTVSNPAGSWRLDEGAGTSVTDYSGNGLTGTTTNATYSSDIPMQKRKTINNNLVLNGDFEYAPPLTAVTVGSTRWIDGTATGSTTNDIFGWGFVNGNASAQFDSTVKKNGSYSLKFSSVSTGIAAQISLALSTTQASIQRYAVPVLPNTSYTLSCWIKTAVTTPGTAVAGTFITLSERVGTGGQVTATESAHITGTQDWTFYSITVVTGSTTRYILPKLHNETSGGTQLMDAWFDDIMLTPTTAGSRGNPQDYKSSLAAGDLLSNSSSLADTSTTSVSAAFWLLPKAYNGNTICGFYASDGINESIRFNIENNTGYPFVWVIGSGGSGNAIKPTMRSIPRRWQRIVFTYNISNQQVRIYSDGQLWYSATSSQIARVSSRFRVITSLSTDSVADASIYTRVLTDDEVVADYAGALPTSPQLRWLLNEGAGAVANDSSGNGNNGTITGGATFSSEVPIIKRQLMGDNLLRNSDFEYAPPFVAATSTNDRWIDGTATGSATSAIFTWRANINTGGTVGSIQYDTSVKRSGVASLKLDCTTGAAGTVTVGVAATYTRPVGPSTDEQRLYMVPVLPSTSYTLSGYIKTSNIVTSGSRGARLRSVEYGGASTASTGSSNTTYLAGTNDWTLATTTFTTNANSRFIHIWLQLDSSDSTTGTAWFDDITLTPTVNTTRTLVS